jgi:gamma-glutamyl-gamma-aminobutyrate hydrolase PuuD
VRPIIGITCYVERAAWGVWEAPAALLPLTYVRAVEAAGGRPVLVPPTEDGVPETLAALDGLVLAGGSDIDPARYGATPHPETIGLRPDRDASEMALAAAALEEDLPLLGVCRGMQVLNVVRGGGLAQHLDDHVDGSMHRHAPGSFARHDVELAEGSLLCRVLGDRTSVHSYHHQAPSTLGRGLNKVAWAEDGTVEGIEDPGRDFAVGILWHPEQGDDRKLFEALVERAGAHARLRT